MTFVVPIFVTFVSWVENAIGKFGLSEYVKYFLPFGLTPDTSRLLHTPASQSDVGPLSQYPVQQFTDSVHLLLHLGRQLF